MCTSFCRYAFISLGYILGSGIAGSYGNFMFNFLRDYQAVFQSDCIIFHSCPNDKWCWTFFHVFIGHLCIFFGEMSIQILCLFLKIGLSFNCWIARVLYIFWIQVSCQIHALQISSPILQVVFSLFWWRPLTHKSF